MPDERPTILLVDDDTDFLEMNRHLLEAAGYRVLCLTGPARAIETMAAQKPCVVVTDLMMSALDSGFSLARQIKEDARFRDVPVVIVTAISSQRGFDFRPRTPEELSAMCADAFFQKPVSPGDLAAKVRELVRRRQKEQTR